MKRGLSYLLLILAVVVLDQVTKAIVVQKIGLHDYVPLVDGVETNRTRIILLR